MIGGTWWSIHQALTKGLRGLPGGSSLAKERDALVGARRRGRLTRQGIIDAVMAHHRDHGSWPRFTTTGTISGLGYSWSGVGRALRDGRVASFPKGSSFTKLVMECQGRSAPAPLTIAMVRKAVRAFYEANGTWPSRSAPGEVPVIGGKWMTLGTALSEGLRGLPKQGTDGRPLSLARIVAQLSGVPVRSKPLTVELIQESMVAWRRKEGQWPSSLTDGVAPKIGVKWRSLNSFLRTGSRGLPSGLSLAKVRGMIEDRGRRG